MQHTITDINDMGQSANGLAVQWNSKYSVEAGARKIVRYARDQFRASWYINEDDNKNHVNVSLKVFVPFWIWRMALANTRDLLTMLKAHGVFNIVQLSTVSGKYDDQVKYPIGIEYARLADNGQKATMTLQKCSACNENNNIHCNNCDKNAGRYSACTVCGEYGSHQCLSS